MGNHTSGADHRTRADGYTTADRGICSDPYIFFQRDGCRSTDSLTALSRVNRMSGAGQTDAGAINAPALILTGEVSKMTQL